MLVASPRVSTSSQHGVKVTPPMVDANPQQDYTHEDLSQKYLNNEPTKNNLAPIGDINVSQKPITSEEGQGQYCRS